MEQKTTPDFIVIDDEAVNNMICLKIVQSTFPGAVVHTFTEPEQGLEYIIFTYLGNDIENAVLFLDINMPILTGWDVLDKFEKYSTIIKERLKIFILSSSVDARDKQRALNNPLVTDYIPKPLSKAKLQWLFPEYV